MKRSGTTYVGLSARDRIHYCEMKSCFIVWSDTERSERPRTRWHFGKLQTCFFPTLVGGFPAVLAMIERLTFCFSAFQFYCFGLILFCYMTALCWTTARSSSLSSNFYIWIFYPRFTRVKIIIIIIIIIIICLVVVMCSRKMRLCCNTVLQICRFYSLYFTKWMVALIKHTQEKTRQWTKYKQ